MKQFHLKAFALFLLLLPLCAVRGQSVVTEVQYTKSDTTIVRHWTEGISIVYTHNSDNDNYFLLVDPTVVQVRRIAVPSYVTVNDFRILHDSVFLCGHVIWSGTQYGLLTCFAIQDFYNGSGDFHYGATYLTDMLDCGNDPALGGGYCRNMIYDILRMTVYDSSGFTKVAYIAKNYVNCPPDIHVGIGSACYHGTGGWRSWIIYNKHAVEEYTDIIATKNYVVAVGRTNDSARLVMRIYPKGSFLVPSWSPYYGYLNAWPYYADRDGQRMSDLEVDENVMATALDNDAFAVAYHYVNAPGEGLAVKTFNITGMLASLMQGMNAPLTRLPGSVWKMRDVRYSPALMDMMVLNDVDGGTTGGQASVVYKFHLPALLSGSYLGKYLSGYALHSLDLYNPLNDAFVVSGNKSGGYYLTLYWEAAGMVSGCGVADVITGSNSSAPLYQRPMGPNMNNPRILCDSLSFVVDEVERDEICNQ